MPLNDYYLIGALLLLLIELIHFICQKKLNDGRTQCFLGMLIASILICSLGILNSYFLIFHPNSVGIKLCAMGIYLSEWLLPFSLFLMNCRILRTNKSWLTYLVYGVFLIGALVIVSNYFTGVISYYQYPYLYVGPYYSIFIYTMLFLYGFNILFTFFNIRKLTMRYFLSLVEVPILLIFGFIIQTILKIQLFVGLSATIALTVIYLTLNNPIAYIDLSSHCFNLDYLNYCLYEYRRDQKNVYFTLIKLNFMDDSLIKEQHLLNTILYKLVKLAKSEAIFKFEEDTFLIIHHNQNQHCCFIENLKQGLVGNLLKINGHLFVPVKIVDIDQNYPFTNENEWIQYLRFINHQEVKEGWILNENEPLHAKFLYEQEVVNFLYDAIKEDRFSVAYQPIYDVKKHQFSALEALSRLYHPRLGWISPEVFIRLAEKKGLIYAITPLQIHRICKFLKENQENLKSINNVKVNLSPVEIAKTDYCLSLLKIIQNYDLPLSLFQFEITESIATNYSKELHELIKIMKENQIKICLDDFGSGYANLSSILKLPFSIIKLDRSLLVNITTNSSSEIFYRNMVRTLQEMGYLIVCEGVETKEEAMLLTKMSVNFIQGYYYSRPLEDKKLIEMLNSLSK